VFFVFRTLLDGGYAKMTRRVNQVLWGQWRQRLERQRASGLSIAGFCRKEGVSTVTFHTWKRKLQAEAAAPRSVAETAPGPRPAERSVAVPPRRRPRPARTDAGTLPRSASFVQLPIVGAHLEPCVELTLVEGTLVRIPPQHLAALQMVFTILRGGAVPATTGEVPHA
jgi:transposase-like protein